jgi:hypothetical protein
MVLKQHSWRLRIELRGNHRARRPERRRQ